MVCSEKCVTFKICSEHKIYVACLLILYNNSASFVRMLPAYSNFGTHQSKFVRINFNIIYCLRSLLFFPYWLKVLVGIYAFIFVSVFVFVSLSAINYLDKQKIPCFRLGKCKKNRIDSLEYGNVNDWILPLYTTQM